MGLESKKKISKYNMRLISYAKTITELTFDCDFTLMGTRGYVAWGSGPKSENFDIFDAMSCQWIEDVTHVWCFLIFPLLSLSPCPSLHI